jgi:hypothetical protein
MRKFMLASAAVATLASGSAGLAQPRPGGGQAPGQATSSQPTGSFQQTCRNIQVQGGNLTAECQTVRGAYTPSTINFSGCAIGITNQNGVLTCGNGPGAQGRDDGQRNRNSNNNGQIAAGVAAGAVLGALGANAYNNQQQAQPGPPPPPPGDDWRYGQQGWGYGHRPGEWISIRDRDVWLSRRIDRAVDNGDLSRREAHDLRRDMQGLEGLEYRYLQQGLAPWMRDDLDRRFQGLTDRVRDSNPPPPPPRYGDDRYAPPPPQGGYYGR